MFCFNTVTTEDPRKGLFRPRAFRPSFINRVRPTTTTTQAPRRIIENDKIEEQNEPVTVQRNRVSLFSSPRRRFRPRPRQEQSNVDASGTTTRYIFT